MNSQHFRAFLGLGFLLLLSCDKAKVRWTEKASEMSVLNKLNAPLGFSGFLYDPKDKNEIEALNATYYFLVAQRKSMESSNDEALVALERARKLDENSSFIHFFLAQEYLRKGLSAEGVAYAQKALELDPKNREAKILLANLYATAKKNTEARKLFSELLQVNPDDEEVVLYLVLLELEQKHNEQAQARLRAYLKRNADSALGHFYLGRLLQEQNRNKEAIASFERAVDIRANFVQAGTYLAVLYEEVGEKKKATQTYAWLALLTDGAAFHKKLGELYLLNKEYEKALGSFQNFERLDSTDLNNKVKVALLQTELRRYPEAIKSFEGVLRDSPESDNIRFYLASVYDQSSLTHQALREYSRVPFKSKLYPEALRYQVTHYRKHKQPDAAEGLIEKALQEAQKEKLHEDDLREIRLNFWDSTGRGVEALAELDSLLKKNPEAERFLYIKGSVLERAGRLDDAVKSMRRILAKDPNHAGALNFIGYVWTERGIHLAEAESYIRRALKLRPADPFIMDSLGWLLFKRGRVLEAFKMLSEAYALKPDEAVISDHLGDVLVKMGRHSEAKEHYEKALKLGPDRDSDKTKLEAKIQALDAHSSLSPSAANELRDSRRPTSAQPNSKLPTAHSEN